MRRQVNIQYIPASSVGQHDHALITDRNGHPVTIDITAQSRIADIQRCGHQLCPGLPRHILNKLQADMADR